jgi:hypothetical protein
VFFGQLLHDEAGCASYVLGCPTHGRLGSGCGRGLSASPVSTIGFERRHNAALRLETEDEFVAALARDIPRAPEDQAAIIAANRSGRALAQDR